MSQFTVSTLKTCNDRNPQVHLLHNLNKTLSNSITSYNTTKDIDKDSRHLRVSSDQLESVLDSGRCSSTTDIQEVGRVTAVQLDDVHGRHGQTGTVDKASNVTVQLDEVEVVLGRLDFIGVFLRLVAPGHDLLLSEVGVVVEPELGIHGHDLVISRLRPGVNLNLCAVLVLENSIHLLQVLSRFRYSLIRESNLSGNFRGEFVGEAFVDVDGVGLDCGGVRFGDFFNVHSSLRGGDDDGALALTVHEDGEVELSAGEFSFDDVDGFAGSALLTGLLRDELVADHFGGEGAGFGWPAYVGKLS